MQNTVSKATLGRLPQYLRYIKALDCENISATKIADALSLGDVQVRKDLNAVCGAGKPRTGYDRKTLEADLEKALCTDCTGQAVIIGAGKLGLALFGYNGFLDYGLEISAAFDENAEKLPDTFAGKRIYPMTDLTNYCRMNDIRVGILTVPASSAQAAADSLIKAGVRAIWNFAPVILRTPKGVTVRNENLALSLAHLNLSANR